ncbi:MAG: hypothetical protein ACKVQK_13075 [Burkholderiales bacterium]
MRQASSTSNSESLRYLALLVSVAALMTLLIATIAGAGLLFGAIAFPVHELLQYQREKIDATTRVDTAFFGDSTLGNAIDSRTWNASGDKPTLNLALAGTFGYAGSLNLSRRLLEHAMPRRNVYMHALDMMTREPAYLGYLHSADRLFPLDEVPIEVIVGAYLNLDNAQATLRYLLRGRDARASLGWSTDYPPQRALSLNRSPAYRERHVALALRTEQINPRKLLYLRRIAALCAEQKFDCVYVHGPVIESYCRNSGPYIERVGQMIRDTGLRVIDGTPLCVPLEEIGDSDDHVAPAFKGLYSGCYRELIEGAPQSTACQERQYRGNAANNRPSEAHGR